MPAKIRWMPFLFWLAISCIAALSCSLGRPATHIGPEYFPFGNDSFYHAARILEAARDPESFYEFDPKIHAPDGSLLVWPWGYDYVMAKVVRAALAVGLGSDPLITLLWIPVIAVFISVALLMVVARRLGLGDWTMALAGLCLALSASTQLLHSFGQIDHHYAEFISILASLAAGLAWFHTPRISSSIILGVTFGIALAVHNALFILQAPFLASAVLLWLQGWRASTRPIIAFTVALLSATLAILLPSQPFQESRFEFYMLSWFHLYVVTCSAIVMVLLTRLRPTRRNIAVMAGVAVVLLAPLANQIVYARSFVDGSLGMLDQILEMRSPLQMVRDGELGPLLGFYSLFGLIAPLTLVLCAIRIWQERTNYRLLFWIWCVFGLALMTTQVRMHYFGTFALFLPWLVVAQEAATRWPERSRPILLVTSLALVLAYSPVIRYALIAPTPKAGESSFVALYPLFAPLREACASDPGVVLADSNAGHYIRYFTKCSVIANNFLLTPQQFQKADEVTRLFSLPVAELVKQAPFVKYVLVRAGGIKSKGLNKYEYAFFGHKPKVAVKTLLLGPTKDIPSDFHLLYEVTARMHIPDSGQTQDVPYGKLYKIERPSRSHRATSANDVTE